MNDILNIAVVNFHDQWGDKEANLNRIMGYIECGAARGAQMIVFPEMCLTGYDDITQTPKKEKMQTLLAETISGTSALQIEELAKKHGVYVMLGMPERDANDPSVIYNTMAVFSPQGQVRSYRKIHLCLNESAWGVGGSEPLLLDTPWGPIGCAICYDVYYFPELIRYYAAKGARMVINSTALAKTRGANKGRMTLETACIVNGIYMATANLCGQEPVNDFFGGSNVIGPSQTMHEVYYYAGKAFGEEHADEQQMYLATIDLSLAKRGIYQPNPLTGKPDFNPEIYAKLYSSLL